MTLSAKVRRAPSRVVAGAFILNSGVSKLGIDDDGAKQLHGMAAGAYPLLEKIPPKPFARALAAGEIALGGALLLPIVPPAVVGLGLVGFSGGLLVMWWRTPGMHEEGSIRPTQQGIAIAKDSWLFGIGAALIADAVLDPAHNKRVGLTHDVKTATARRAARATSRARLIRARAEFKAAKTAAKAAAQAKVAKRASQRAFDKVAH